MVVSTEKLPLNMCLNMIPECLLRRKLFLELYHCQNQVHNNIHYQDFPRKHHKTS